MIHSVAFIGLGAMGYRMAAHLPKHFETVFVWNRNFSKANNMQLNMEPLLFLYKMQFRQTSFFLAFQQAKMLKRLFLD